MSERDFGEIIVYQSEDGLTHVDVRFEGDSVWLTQAQLIELYHSSKSNISEHIKHILEDGELSEEATVRKFRTVQTEGTRQVSRDVTHYNPDMIIAIGYMSPGSKSEPGDSCTLSNDRLHFTYPVPGGDRIL